MTHPEILIDLSVSKQGIVDKRDRIVEAACTAVLESGVAGLTVAEVGSRAGVSSALVHYHYDTKQRLLAAACERLAARRSHARLAALESGPGLQALDALWDALVTGAHSGAERAWHDLSLLARNDQAVRRLLARERRSEQHAFAGRLPRVLSELGAESAMTADEAVAVVVLFLDGVALRLTEGAEETDVRAAYDAFWLALVKAGQARAR